MIHRIRFFSIIAIFLIGTICICAVSFAGESAFEIKRIGNIHSYDDNAFMIRTEEKGEVTIRIHDNICVYRTLNERVEAGETIIHWDGCGYNQEKLYEKTYTITAEMKTDTGLFYSVSFASPVEYPLQCLQYAMPSSEELYLDAPEDWFIEYRTVTKGTVIIELNKNDEKNAKTELGYQWHLAATGGKIARRTFDSFMGKILPEAGDYTLIIYEQNKPEQKYQYILHITEAKPEKALPGVTGEIMPGRDMTESEIWEMMQQPSVVVDIDFFKHQEIYREPDSDSGSLGTVHGQTQALKVIRIDGEWAFVGAWNHEEAAYVEGWVPLARLKIVKPHGEYGILIDKQKQTLSVYQNGKIIDTVLVSTGRAEKKALYQETSAGCFLTGYHRVNFSMNGKKYDYVIQYDGGNLLHQTPYNWGEQKKDFTLGRGYLGAKASHACIRIQPEPGEGGVNAYWIFTHIPYHTRIIILDDKEEREGICSLLKRSVKDEPDLSKLRTTEIKVKDEKETVTMTFCGCLTPGGSRTFNKRGESFVTYCERYGYKSPMEEIQSLLENDDLTCVNLTGLMQGNAETYPEDKAIVCAPAGMEEIFRNTSVEMVQITDDRIQTGNAVYLKQTADAVSEYTSVLNSKDPVTLTVKGHIFGFAGCCEKEYLQDPDVINRRINALKDAKSEKIIFMASWGEDSSVQHSVIQEAMAHRAVRAGADLVVGSHKGIIQGIDSIEGTPVVYSLGDLLDGSTAEKPKKQQGILIRAEFGFTDEKEDIVLTVIPILPYGKGVKNDYCPSMAVSQAEWGNVIKSIWEDTADWILEKILFLLE